MTGAWIAAAVAGVILLAVVLFGLIVNLRGAK